MKKQKYQIFIYVTDESFPTEEFVGEFWAITPEQAKTDAIDFYAHQCDTTPDHVKISNIKAI